MKGTTRLLALCGVLTALGVVLLCLGGIVPFALYICPILASIALLPQNEGYTDASAEYNGWQE